MYVTVPYMLYVAKDIASIEGKKIPVEENDKVVPVTGYKRTMVKTMTKSGGIPQFGYCDEVRMDALIRQVHEIEPNACMTKK